MLVHISKITELLTAFRTVEGLNNNVRDFNEIDRLASRGLMSLLWLQCGSGELLPLYHPGWLKMRKLVRLLNALLNFPK